MSESVIADFVGTFNTEGGSESEPTRGRVVLGEDQLVLAVARDDTLTVPVSAIHDVAVGQTPPHLGPFQNATVTIAFERDGQGLLTCVAAKREAIEKFAAALFSALLAGTNVSHKKRARVGDSATEDPFQPAALSVSERALVLRSESTSVAIEPAAVTEIERDVRAVGGEECPAYAVRRTVDGTAVTTVLATHSLRTMSLLGRYLRFEYGECMPALRDLELSEPAIDTAVGIYSEGGVSTGGLARGLEMEAHAVAMLLAELREAGLLADTDDGPRLTAKGNVVASRNLDRIAE